MENSALLLAIVHNAIDGIITLDENGAIESINPSACSLFGYSQEELIGSNITILLPYKDRGDFVKALQDYESTNGLFNFGIGNSIIGVTKKGYQFPFQLGISEVHYTDRRIYAAFIHDLTVQKVAEEGLKNYASHLEELVEDRTKTLHETITALEKTKERISVSLEKEKELSKLKNRFLSMASHEFRTPLSTVQLSASLIEKYAEPFSSAAIGKHVLKIENAVSSLTAILTDFLYMEQLETGTVKAKPTWFDLQELATEITEEMQVLIKGNQKIQYTQRGASTPIFLDYNLLKNTIINLLSNAIKYAGEMGDIVFTTEINSSYCIIQITDHGIGIPKEDQKHVFEPFFRANNTGNIPGTGIGLNLVKRYVTLMNGTIDFASTTNSGTVFTLTFQLC